MSTHSSQFSDDSGHNDPFPAAWAPPSVGPPTQVSPKILLVLAGLVLVITYGISFAIIGIRRANEDRTTRKLCETWAYQILTEAKQASPEIGTYEATLPVNDSWE